MKYLAYVDTSLFFIDLLNGCCGFFFYPCFFFFLYLCFIVTAPSYFFLFFYLIKVRKRKKNSVLYDFHCCHYPNPLFSSCEWHYPLQRKEENYTSSALSF